MGTMYVGVDQTMPLHIVNKFLQSHIYSHYTYIHFVKKKSYSHIIMTLSVKTPRFNPGKGNTLCTCTQCLESQHL